MSPRNSPGREQLVLAAFALIGERGFKAATVRALADHAGVTPGLVVHHFGTKDELAAEVERTVLKRFEAVFAGTEERADPAEVVVMIAQELSQTIGRDPALRRYTRRAILEASPAGAAIIQRLVELTENALRRFPDAVMVRDRRSVKWLAVQIVTINLAATLLEPLLEPIINRDAFAPTEVRWRTDANLRLITSALKSLGPDSQLTQ